MFIGCANFASIFCLYAHLYFINIFSPSNYQKYILFAPSNVKLFNNCRNQILTLYRAIIYYFFIRQEVFRLVNSTFWALELINKYPRNP